MNEQQYYFSATTLGFYPLSMKPDYVAAGSWPDDAKEIPFETFLTYSQTPPEGKMRGADKKGRPAWADIPPPTHDDLVKQAEQKKQQLLAQAATAIAPLQDAVDLDIATDEEKSLLLKWKQYRVAVNRIDTNLAPDIDWPEQP